MIKWEYATEWMGDLDQDRLNSFGQEGWELVGFVNHDGWFKVVFKRPLERVPSHMDPH